MEEVRPRKYQAAEETQYIERCQAAEPFLKYSRRGKEKKMSQDAEKPRESTRLDGPKNFSFRLLICYIHSFQYGFHA